MESLEAKPCLTDNVRRLLSESGKDDVADDLEKTYIELLARRIDFIHYGDPALVDDLDRARSNCRLLQQMLLHRAERLMVSAGSMLEQRNVYGLALLVRGHFECTALLGYTCHRLQSCLDGNLSIDDVTWSIASATLGNKSPDINAATLAPINIMTCIEKTDRFLLKTVPTERESRMVADCYGWLSEFAHPNFLSNSCSVEIDKTRGGMVLRHDADLVEREISIIGYLHISAGLFLVLFDTLETLAAKVFDRR